MQVSLKKQYIKWITNEDVKNKCGLSTAYNGEMTHRKQQK